MESPYKVLGIPESSTEAEIKAAYRRLARKLHPDRTGGDKEAENRLKEVNQAYEKVLRRASGDFLDFEEAFSGRFSDDFFSIFSGLHRPRPPAPQAVDMPVTFEESLSGAIKYVSMARKSPCPACSARRSKSCAKCNGQGVVSSADRVQFQIQPGSGSGDVIPSRSDLGYPMVARLLVESSPVWERSGLDLKVVVPVPAPRFRPGQSVKAASPYGDVEIAIPSGFHTDQWLSVPGHGVRHYSGRQGRLLVRLVAEVEAKDGEFPRSQAYEEWVASRKALS